MAGNFLPEHNGISVHLQLLDNNVDLRPAPKISRCGLAHSRQHGNRNSARRHACDAGR